MAWTFEIPENWRATAVVAAHDRDGQPSVDKRSGLPEWDVSVIDPSDPGESMRVRVPADTELEQPGSKPRPVRFTRLRFVKACYQPHEVLAEGGVAGWFYADAVEYSEL